MEPTDLPQRHYSRPNGLSEFLRIFRPGRDGDRAASPAATLIAEALAERLEAVVPPPFHVRAEDGWVSRFNGDYWDGSSDVARAVDLPEEDDNSDDRREAQINWIVSSCWGVLSSVQDMISEATTEPWPRLPHGGMANPGTRLENGCVYLWYGLDEKSDEGAMLVLPPIELISLNLK
jgi:hypothetical protein